MLCQNHVAGSFVTTRLIGAQKLLFVVVVLVLVKVVTCCRMQCVQFKGLLARLLFADIERPITRFQFSWKLNTPGYDLYESLVCFVTHTLF